MVDRICVVLEGLSIAVCLHRLYGKKFRFDIATVSLITIEMIMMQAIDYFGWPSILSELFAPFILVYCVIEFGFDLKKLIINNILNAIIICILQIGVMTMFYTFDSQNTIVGIRLVFSNIIVLLALIFFPQFSEKTLKGMFKNKETILNVAFTVSIFIIMFWVISFKKVNFFNRANWLQNILFSGCVVLIVLLALRVGKYKIKSKEIETELKMHRLYSDSFDNLIDNIRSRQHEFDNHINTIYSQHYIYNTYEGLVKAQKKYCKSISIENRFNKLLVVGNPVIIGFLYGKFNEIDKLGIDIEYHVSIGEVQIGMPIYKLVEVLGNLIGNAVEELKDNKKYKRLYVFMVEKDKKLSLEIRNESDYISYTEMELFFIKGYSRKGENRGLGLFHVKAICDEYNLSISCQNKEIDETNWISFTVSNKKETI